MAQPDAHGRRTAVAPARILDAVEQEPQADDRRGASLHREITTALEHAGSGGAVAVLRVRLVDLPLVTEALGRPAGDALLALAANAIAEAVGPAGAVARLPGGDICVLLDDVGGGDGVADARHMGDRIVAALDETTVVEGEEVRQAVTVGIALAPRHATAPDELLELAARAARASDGSDPGPVRIASVQASTARSQVGLRARLERVVDRDELQLVYQPIFDLRTSRPSGVEALLRWHDPTRGTVPPDEFIPTAEATGAIHALGRWVLEELCRHAHRWRAQGIDLQLHFNVSPLEICRQRFASDVLSIIRAHTLPPSSFTLEVTASTAVVHADAAVPALRQLRAEGMRVAIDDFGAGHSSLSRIRDMPADLLKIDRGIVAGLPRNAAARALVEAALSVARALGMETVAEGIETEAQRACLTDLGCPFGQGYALGRPERAVMGTLAHVARPSLPKRAIPALSR